MDCLKLLFEENAEASVFVIRELVLLDADDTSNLGELGFVPVQGRDVDGRDLDREVFVGGLGLNFLMLWWLVVLGVILFPIRVEVCFFAEERGLRIGWWSRIVSGDRW